MSGSSRRGSRQSPPSTAPPPHPEEEAEETAEQLAKSAEILFSGLKVPEGADLTDRKLRLTLQRAALRHHQSVTRFADTLGECIGKQVDADNEDREKRREAEFGERREGRTGEERRTEKLLAQEIRERETERMDRSRERNVFMALTALSVIGTLGLAFVSAMHAHPWFYAGSGIGLVLSAGSLLRLQGLGALR